MNILPNYQQAIIPLEKLRDYCLNAEHPVGKHKALVFLSALNITANDSDLLAKKILEKLGQSEAVKNGKDEYGERFYVDIEITNFDKEAIVRTSWILKVNENTPRLTSCYVIS